MDERVEIVEETIWEALAAYRASATATVVDTETIRLGITGVPYAGLNGVFRARGIGAAAVEETLLLFRRRGVPMLWHVGPQTSPGVETLVLAAGLEFDEDEPGMFARLDTPGHISAVPAGLRIEPVRDLETLGRWVDILSGGRLDAITAATVELARRHGNGYAVLTASPDGEGLYRRLGFVTVCSVRRFLQRSKP